MSLIPTKPTIAIGSAAAGVSNIMEGVATAALLYKTFVGMMNKGSDLSTSSLTQYTKPLRMCSRVYIDQGVYDQPVITDIIKIIHTQYAGLILAALQLNQFVTSSRTVSDMLKVVASESNQDYVSILQGMSAANEALTRDEREDRKDTRDQERHDKDMAKDKQDAINRSKPGTPSGQIVSFAGDSHVPAGKILEVVLTNPNDSRISQTINLLVQLSPYVIPTSMAEEFITKDHVPSLKQRIVQWRTGEISFWNDLVAMGDIAARRKQVSKMDPSGVCADMIADQNKSKFRLLTNLFSEKAQRARNIANSVVIFDNMTVQRAKATTGFDLTRDMDRKKYFEASFVMILVIIDTKYSQVTFYYNGIDDSSTFSYDQIKTPTKGGQNIDLLSVMSAFNQGRSPKF